MVELRDIRVYLALCEELHFARTARRVRLSPSRVSQIIGRLERQLGGRLVERAGRGIALTGLGEQVRRELGEAYGQVAAALDRVRVAGGVGREQLRLQLSDLGGGQIPRIVRAFEQVYPDSVVEVTEVPVCEPFGPLRRGEVDLMAGWLPHGQAGLVTGPIVGSEPRVLAVSAEHVLAGRDGVSIEEVADFTVMRFAAMPRQLRQVWIPATTPAGRPIAHRDFSHGSVGDRGRMTSELGYLIAAGRVVHPTVPSFRYLFGHPDIVYVPIVDLPPLCSALLWRRDTTNPRVSDFARIAEMVVTSNGGPDGTQLPSMSAPQTTLPADVGRR